MLGSRKGNDVTCQLTVDDSKEDTKNQSSNLCVPAERLFI